jgi:F-type H+-transporting ATPase subunit b
LAGLGINLGLLLLQILSFIIVFVILSAWVFTPIMVMLEKRREKVAMGIEDARVASEARKNAEMEAQKIIADAQAQANHVIRESTERAAEAAREVVNQGETEAAKLRSETLAEIQAEREKILGDMRGQVAALAMAATQKLIGVSIDQQRGHTLINEFFSGIRSGKVVVLDEEKFVGTSAEVTSALPLTAEERESVSNDILSRVGFQATVTFRVDPGILGGLVVRIGDKVLDGSVAGQLEAMRQTLS